METKEQKTSPRARGIIDWSAPVSDLDKVMGICAAQDYAGYYGYDNDDPEDEDIRNIFATLFIHGVRYARQLNFEKESELRHLFADEIKELYPKH